MQHPRCPFLTAMSGERFSVRIGRTVSAVEAHLLADRDGVQLRDDEPQVLDEHVRELIDRDDVCEPMPNPTDGRLGKRLYGRVGAREFHIIVVVNPGDTLHTVTTVYEVDRKHFPDGRTRRRKR
jgi:hypothetical protein